MTEYGIWGDEEGGFVDTGLYSKTEADESLRSIAAKADEGCDYHIREVCPEHEEQPRDECEECNADEEELFEQMTNPEETS